MKKEWHLLLYGVLIGLIVGGAILLVSKPRRGSPINLSPAPTPTQKLLPQPTKTSMPMQIQIKGEVNNPGIYELPHFSRVSDLIEISGGITSSADVDRINLAIMLHDGDLIYIPAVDEKIPEIARNAPQNLDSALTSQIDYPININQASQEALETLPGIGPIKAKDIIAHRDEFGYFSNVEDLLNVSGIGPNTLELIREYIFVEP